MKCKRVYSVSCVPGRAQRVIGKVACDNKKDLDDEKGFIDERAHGWEFPASISLRNFELWFYCVFLIYGIVDVTTKLICMGEFLPMLPQKGHTISPIKTSYLVLMTLRHAAALSACGDVGEDLVDLSMTLPEVSYMLINEMEQMRSQFQSK